MNRPTGSCYHAALTQISLSAARNSVECLDEEVGTPGATLWQEGIGDIEMGGPFDDDIPPPNDGDPPPPNNDNPPPPNDPHS